MKNRGVRIKTVFTISDSRVFLVPQLFGWKDDAWWLKIIVQMFCWKLRQESSGSYEDGRICCCPTEVFNILFLYRVESKAAPTTC